MMYKMQVLEVMQNFLLGFKRYVRRVNFSTILCRSCYRKARYN